MSIEHTPNWPGWQTVRCLMQDRYGSVYEIHRQTFGEVEKAALKVITIPHDPSEVQHLRSRGYDESSIRAHFHDQCDRIVRSCTTMMQIKEHGNIVRYDDYRMEHHTDGIGWTVHIKTEPVTPLTACLEDLSKDAAILAQDLCKALMFCHGRTIVHGDIQPRSIFRGADGRFKLSDFGFSGSLGRTAYAAPEVRQGQAPSIQSDIYSLGMVMYWMLNHRQLPNPSQDSRQLPAPALGSSTLDHILLKACAYDPTQRYASAAQMLEDLKMLLMYDGSDASRVIVPDGTDAPSGKKRSSVPWIIATVIALLLIVATLLCSILFRPSEKDANKQTGPTPGLYATSETTLPQNPSPVPSATIPPATVPPTTVPPETNPSPSQTAPTLPKETEPESDPADVLFQAVKDQCSAWEAAGDYLSAVQYLKGLADTDTRYAELFQQYESKLCEQVLSAADRYTAQQQYRLALKTIYDARKSYNCEAYTQAIIEIQQDYSTHRIAASKFHSMYVHKDGTVSLVGFSEKTGCSVSGWNDVVSAATGDAFIAGLKGNGTVVCSGTDYLSYSGSESWQNITVLAAGDSHLAGLRTDGTVFVTDDYLKDDHRIAELYSDSPIVSLAAGWRFTVALHADGTVTATGRNDRGQCNVSSWKDIVAICCGSEHTVGLTANGTVLIAGNSGDGQDRVSRWTDIDAISAGDYLTMGLKSNGTVLALGQNMYDQCEVSHWTNIVEIAGGSAHTLGRTASGTVIPAGTNVNDLQNTHDFVD